MTRIVPIIVATCLAMLSACSIFTSTAPGDAVNVLITAPPSNTSTAINQPVQISVSASAASGVARLELSANGTLVAVSNNPSDTKLYAADITYRPQEPGAINLIVRAFDRNGNASAPVGITLQVTEAGQATLTVAATPSVTATAANPAAATISPPTAAPTNPPPSGQVKPSITPCSTAPQIGYFNANPNSIASGTSSKLQWGDVKNADAAAIDNGVGNVPLQGEKDVKPNSTTTYKLTASGCGGKTTAQVTVNVTAAIPVPKPISPVSNASINCTFVRLSWQAVSMQGGASYGVELETKQGGSWQFFSGAQNISNTYYDLPQSLSSGTQARWRVWATSLANGTDGKKSDWEAFSCK